MSPSQSHPRQAYGPSFVTPTVPGLVVLSSKTGGSKYIYVTPNLVKQVGPKRKNSCFIEVHDALMFLTSGS